MPLDPRRQSGSLLVNPRIHLQGAPLARDFALAFLHVQAAWDRHPGNPVSVLLAGLAADPLRKYFAVTTIVALIAPAWLVRRGQPELAAFSWVSTLIPLTTSLVAMPRFVWWQAPLLLLVGVLAARRRLWIILLPAGIIGLPLMNRGWFSGHNFVV